MNELLELLKNSESAGVILYFAIAIAAGLGAIAQANITAADDQSNGCKIAVFKLTDILATFFVASLWPFAFVITIVSVFRYSYLAEIKN